MTTPAGHIDLTRNTLAVLCIVGLIAAAFWILRPFVPALIWATMVVVATWPLMLLVQQKLWRQRWLAVTVMSLALLLVFVGPLALAIDAIVANVDTMAVWAQELAMLQLPQPPDWLHQIPIVGEKAALTWNELADSGPKELAKKLAPYAQDVAQWVVLEVGGFGLMAAQFLLTVAISAVLYAHGEAAAVSLLRFSQRLAGAQGQNVIHLAGQAIRGVALGVVVTAVIQSLLAGLGLVVAGIPLAALLTAVAFLLAVAQIGATPVLIVAVAWLYWKDDTAWATALLLWALVVGSLDNVLRPFLIRMGADLPILLIFAGVIGGLLAFGLVGIFVGPLVLAIAYTLTQAWIDQPEAGGEPQEPTPPPTSPPAAPDSEA